MILTFSINVNWVVIILYCLQTNNKEILHVFSIDFSSNIFYSWSVKSTEPSSKKLLGSI